MSNRNKSKTKLSSLVKHTTKKKLSSDRVNFLECMIKQYRRSHEGVSGKSKGPRSPQEFVDSFTGHYQKLYDSDIEKGVVRKLSYLSSVQSNLSRFKKELQARGVPDQWLKDLHLPKKESIQLMHEKKNNVRNSSINLPLLQGDDIIRDCRTYLRHPNKYVKIIAVAALTGRRESEIILSMVFGPPRDSHFTDEKYWSCVTGILKQRTEGGVVSREVPFLANRREILNAVTAIRKECPAKDVGEVNRKYAKGISRTLHKFCPELGKLHEFRKFYVAVCYHYFNEQHCSLPRVAADYLGHKTMSETVLTYLSARLSGMGGLCFGHGKLKKHIKINPNAKKSSKVKKYSKVKS
jgi:hypothetical protein